MESLSERVEQQTDSDDLTPRRRFAFKLFARRIGSAWTQSCSLVTVVQRDCSRLTNEGFEGLLAAAEQAGRRRRIFGVGKAMCASTFVRLRPHAPWREKSDVRFGGKA